MNFVSSVLDAIPVGKALDAALAEADRDLKRAELKRSELIDRRASADKIEAATEAVRAAQVRLAFLKDHPDEVASDADVQKAAKCHTFTPVAAPGEMPLEEVWKFLHGDQTVRVDGKPAGRLVEVGPGLGEVVAKSGTVPKESVWMGVKWDPEVYPLVVSGRVGSFEVGGHTLPLRHLG